MSPLRCSLGLSREAGLLWQGLEVLTDYCERGGGGAAAAAARLRVNSWEGNWARLLRRPSSAGRCGGRMPASGVLDERAPAVLPAFQIPPRRRSVVWLIPEPFLS